MSIIQQYDIVQYKLIQYIEYKSIDIHCDEHWE